MTPGTHRIVIGTSADALQARQHGLELRDTLLIHVPGPQAVFAFLFRVPLDGTTVETALEHGGGHQHRRLSNCNG